MKSNKNNILITLFTFFVMFMSADYFPMAHMDNVSLWASAHWGLTYETGFIFRGLMGTLASALFGKISFGEIYFIFTFFLVVFGALMSYINIKIYKQNPDAVSLILIAFIISQPSGIRWWATASMFGRIDIILVIVSVVIGIFLIKTEKKIMLPAALILSVIAVLTHESFAVLFLSMLFALMLFAVNKDKDKLDLSPLLFYFIPMIIVFVLVTLNGKANVPLSEFKAIVSDNFTGAMRDFDFDLYDVYAAGIDEKIVIATQSIDKVIIIKIILTMLALLPELIFVGHIFKLYIKSIISIKNKILFALVICSLFAPLAALIFGFDFFRWVGYFIICVTIAFISFYLNDEKFKSIAYSKVNENKILVTLLAAANLSFGCFLARNTYPIIEELLQFLLSV